LEEFAVMLNMLNLQPVGCSGVENAVECGVDAGCRGRRVYSVYIFHRLVPKIGRLNGADNWGTPRRHNPLAKGRVNPMYALRTFVGI
jgi:hypothetical protein